MRAGVPVDGVSGWTMIAFVKAHACGNDFLVIEERAAGRNHEVLARRLCSRNTSVGADGIEFVERRGGGANSFCGCSTRMGVRRSFRAMGRGAWRRGWRRAKA